MKKVHLYHLSYKVGSSMENCNIRGFLFGIDVRNPERNRISFVTPEIQYLF